MNHQRRWLCAAGLASALALASCGNIGSPPPAAYEKLSSPVPVSSSQQIEVIEFFWYGCPHCADLHPRLQAWAQTLPSDVVLRFEPVALSEKWLSGSRLYFTLQTLDELPHRSTAVFDAVQLDGLALGDEAAVFAWAAAQGLDQQRFAAAWQSPEVQRRAAQSLEWGKIYQFGGVPTLIVDGKYLTSNRLAGSSPDMLKMLDELIRKARSERADRPVPR